MEHITFPASTKVTLNMRREPFNPDTEEDPNIGGLKRTCAQLASTFECSSPPPPPFTSVHIMLDYRVAMFNLGALRTPTFSGVTTAEQEWYDADDLRVGRPDVTIKSSFDSVLRNLCTTSKAFLGDEVRLLWYSFEYSFDSDSASIFSVAFPRLSVLRLAYPLPKPVLHDLLCGADESGTISSFPALKVLDFEQCWIQDLIGPPEDATAEAPLFSTLAERQQAGLPVAAVYLRLAEEIDDLQSGCNHSCSEYPDAASVQRAVNALIARPEVKIIGKDHDIPYSMYM
ncbi:unnamed protein product [Peniophora sp. CBMAI 1063]|nr:unnamed protein product [Peniophora sp. CBMAI 1063]